MGKVVKNFIKTTGDNSPVTLADNNSQASHDVISKPKRPKFGGRKAKELDTSTYTGRFADRLRMLRDNAGLTTVELAEKSGINKGTLEKWLSGARSPSIEQLPVLAETLGVSIGKIFPKK